MSEVQLVKKEVEVTKELDEAFTALEGIAEDARAGKDVSEVATGNLQKLMTAIQGFDKMDEEVKHDAVYETGGLGVGRLLRALIKTKKQ